MDSKYDREGRRFPKMRRNLVKMKAWEGETRTAGDTVQGNRRFWGAWGRNLKTKITKV